MQQTITLASYIGYKFWFDILYCVNCLARHTLYPSKQVIRFFKELLQFLWQTRSKRLVWNKRDKTDDDANYITGIVDASFAKQEEYKSQYRAFIQLNSNMIGAVSSKLKLTCASSIKTELYGISESTHRFANLCLRNGAIH
ncbi:hypothetical protein TPHA_0I03315 [Tetrapisispora phaffii CBS 4417]|uniref:Uncharacterized protein n=1 Tax=Tetrapisispora phaffii (strain ATCC 24235 / CBS 4417 / NBRC 1672 / NRRL Y-8282 / UCD 70-5) TaxID=1071381 RepID=G8BY55_TETPH|nr:hypothetical protein TPHA_0I03315 [Tetrapisispora phaffii CBS 4417]CCE64833.1 hypothetical protein TPHA_0I03315 [Tetrapisispora phaffii CBS 4417]